MAFQNRTGLHAAFPSGLCRSLAANYAEGIPQKPSGEFQMDERGNSRKGSHRQYKHFIKTGRVTIAGHLNDDLALGSLNSIFRQAQLQKPKKK